MGFVLRALSRNAGRFLHTRAAVSRIPSNPAFAHRFPADNGAFSPIRVNSGSASATGALFTRSYARATAEIEDSGDEDDGADEDINLAYSLEPSEDIPCDKLINKILENRTKSFVSFVKEWQDEGNTLSKDILLKVFRSIRARGCEQQTHRLMNWVLREKAISLTPRVYLLAIMAAQGAHKMNAAKEIFDSIPEEHKTSAIYTAMLNAYAKENDVEDAENILRTYTPKTAQPYNSLMLMYLRLDQPQKAVEVYERLKKSGIKPNKTTYLILAKYTGIELNKSEAKAILNSNLSNLNTISTAVYSAKNAMLAYAYMGDLEGVKKTWALLEQVDNLPTYFYSAGIEAFGKLGKMDMVEKIATKVSDDMRKASSFYPALIKAFVLNNMMDQAEALLQHIMENEVVTLTYRLYEDIIEGYLKRNEFKKALNKMKEARGSVKVLRSRPSYSLVKKLLPVYRKLKDVDGAESLIGVTARVELKVYKELLNVYLEAGKKPADDFLNRLKKIKLKPDDETKQLLDKLQVNC